MAATVAASVVGIASAGPVGAVGIGVNQPTVVSAVPSASSPNITNGVVYAINQVGSQIVVGGSFTTVQNHGSTTTLTRNRVLAFDAGTGAVSTAFAPTFDSTVEAIAAGPTAGTVYVGGAFTNVNGVRSKGIALVDLSTGAQVSGFAPAALNGVVYSIARVGTHLLVAGTFSTAGGAAHAGLVSLNPTTGKVDSWVGLQFAGHHNYTGASGQANGPVGPRAMAVNPDGTRAVLVGNFTSVGGQSHDQIAMIDLDGSSVTVDPWTTLKYTATCFSGAFDTYVTDVQYAADGTYFVVTATGGSGTNSDGSNSLCDSAARWEATSGGAANPVQPTWVDYTGQDTLWSVAITGSAVYVGGHQRWLNNSQGHDNPGEGAVPRPGLAALDPVSGAPLSWNPGRNPRGAGAYALFANSAGLYVGSDTDYIGNNTYMRRKIAYFPLAGGTAPASTATAALPSDLYGAGQLPNSTNTDILYRIHAGGGLVGAVDNGPDWLADASGNDPGAQFRNSSSNAAGYSCCAALSSSVPASAPAALFNSERWDPGSHADGDEMHWSFPVAAGTHVAVRLYFANRCGCTSQVGQRQFDVAVDGSTVLDHYDIVQDVGDQTGTMHEFDVTSPGDVSVDFTHEVENPLVNAIEIVNLDASSTPGTSQDELAYHAVSGSAIGPRTVVPTNVAWGSTRGAFMVGKTLFYGTTDGTFHRATFDGTTLGTPSTIDPYHDPAWSSVETGSGQTYNGTSPTFYSELPQVTGAFYSAGRLYYSVAGQSTLYSRWFSPDSGIVGSDEFTTGGADFSDIAGMVLSGSTLYYAKRSDGSLHSLAFSNGTPNAGTDTTVSGPAVDGIDWRARGLFLYGPATFPNTPPNAQATSSCTGSSCSFDATASNDPDGSIASYSWDFGDGTHATGATATHGYADAGTYHGDAHRDRQPRCRELALDRQRHRQCAGRAGRVRRPGTQQRRRRPLRPSWCRPACPPVTPSCCSSRRARPV